MNDEQDATPVLDEIRRLREQGTYTFSLPGHRFGQGIDDRTAEVIPRSTFGADVLLAKSAVGESEKLYAEAVGCRQAIFTTCGSSISIHVALLTLTGPEGVVLIDRNVHKSVVASLILSGADPVWLRPAWDTERQVAHPATAQTVQETLDATPSAEAVVLITPTEYGSGADVKAVADMCHARNLPLMVDEAWGGHFGFHPDPPTAAVKAGADLAVQSLHKASGGLAQSSMILVGGDIVDPVDLRLRLDLITTTSPSPLMYGSIDGWRRHVALNGKELIDGALRRAGELRDHLRGVPNLLVDDESILQHPGVAEWDPLKLNVDVSALGLTGYQVKEWLMTEHHLAAQLGDARRVVFSITYADDDAGMARLRSALDELAASPPKPDRPSPKIPELEELNLEQAMRPRDAFFAQTENVEDPVGRVSAEMVSPYPPGVPAILPGERFNAAVVEYLRAGLAAGMVIPDASDPELKTFRVVK